MEYLFAIHSVAISGLVVLLILGAASDYSRYVIPNWICLGIALLYGVHVVTSPQPVDWIGGLVAGGGLFVVGVILFSLRFVGGGDVKLATACALWAGPALGASFLVVTSVAGGLLALALLVRLRLARARSSLVSATESEHYLSSARPLPYGVAIATGGMYVAVTLLMK